MTTAHPPAAPWPRLLVLAAAVLLAHAALLSGLPAGLGGQDARPAPSLSVRQIVRPAPAPTTAPPAPADAAPPDAPAPRPPRPLRRATPAAVSTLPADAPTPPITTAEPTPVAATEAATAAIDEPALAPVAVAAAPELAASVSAAPPADALPATPAMPGSPGEAPPTYATRMPPAAVLKYELRRGLLTGQGELRWAPDGPNYDLQIDGTAFGLPVLSWISRGGFDAAGLAPQRFVDRRRGRDLRAANFQRDRGVISFSSVTAEIPLLAGAQDRLSWMVQLAAVIGAAAGRPAPGDRVAMVVAGARGDVDVWTFTVTGREAVDVVGQRIDDTLALRREPRKAFDTLVEVWLDPARHHLPVRLKLSTSGGGGDSMEFVLRP